MDNENVKGIACARLEWSKELGKKMPTFKKIEKSNLVQKADIVLLAMGFLFPEKEGLLSELPFQFDDRGNIKTNNQYATNVKGIFAAGDARRGQSLVVSAISEGRECARQVDIFLNHYQKKSRIKGKALEIYQE